jgi:CheY-like chemotaxis protein
MLADRWGVADDEAALPDGAEDSTRSGRARSSVVEVVSGVVELLEPLCNARGVRLQVELPTADLTACADRVALRHALLAVLMPCIRLAADAHSAALTLTVAHVREGVELRVSGQADLSSADVGLGEARTLLDPVGGAVHLGREGTSSTVRLLLPGASRRTLLVVDNSPDFIRLMQRFLTDRDWEVVGAADVDQAESLARERTPDAVLLDVVMPGRDGLDLLVSLKRSVATAGIPVFVCSVLHEAEVATSLGAAAYLQKPVTQTDLIEALATVS